MARDVSVDLGTFSISSSLNRKFVLTVRTSILISLPDTHSRPPTAFELRDQVKAGSLWITRAGSCIFELSIRFEDPLNDNLREDLEHMIIGAFEALPAWSALGLDVRREYNGFHDQPGSGATYPYSIQHVRQNSSLISPDHVPCAFLSTVCCSLSFGAKKSSAQDVQTQARPQANKTRTVTLLLPPHKLQRFAKNKLHGDERNHLPTVYPRKSRVVTLKVSPHELRRIAVEESGLNGHATDLQEEGLQNLTHTALNSLLGLGKRFSGFRFLHRLECLTLLEMAPSVWNARYFQDIVSRARLAPYISSALGSLTSSESPSIRQKLQSRPFHQVQELHRQILVLILRSSRVPKVNPRGSKSIAHSQKPTEEAIEMNQGHDQDELQRSNSAHATEDLVPFDSVSLRVGMEDAAILMPGTLQGDSLSYEIESDILEDSFSGQSSRLGSQNFPFSSGLYQYDDGLNQEDIHHIGTDMPLDDEYLEATAPCTMEHHDQMVQQHDSPFSSVMSEGGPGFSEEISESQHSDEAYLEAELELSKLLTCHEPCPGSFESEYLMDDCIDDVYFTAQQELAEALACRHNLSDAEKVQDVGSAGLVNVTEFDEAFVGEGLEEDEESHYADNMSICSSTMPFDSQFGDMSFEHTGIHEAGGAAKESDHNTEDYSSDSEEREDWGGFNESRMHCAGRT